MVNTVVVEKRNCFSMTGHSDFPLRGEKSTALSVNFIISHTVTKEHPNSSLCSGMDWDLAKGKETTSNHQPHSFNLVSKASCGSTATFEKAKEIMTGECEQKVARAI